MRELVLRVRGVDSSVRAIFVFDQHCRAVIFTTTRMKFTACSIRKMT